MPALYHDGLHWWKLAEDVCFVTHNLHVFLQEMRRQLLSGAPQANNNLGNNSSVPVTATAQPKEKGAHGTAVGARGGGDDASDAASLLPHNGTSSSGDVARPTGNAGGKHTVQNPLCGAVGSGSEDGGGQGAAQGPHPRISRYVRKVHTTTNFLVGCAAA
jgi:hypothetical protein